MPSRGPLRGREFRLLFAGRAVSSLGDRLVPVALAFAVLDIGSVTDLGIVMGAESLAVVLFVLLGGVWADRLPRRAVMLVADLVRLIAQGVSAVLLIDGSAHVWQLAALQALYGAAAGFFGPASIAIVPEVLDEQQLQPGNALMGLAENASSVLGPALAGVLVATAGAGWGLAFDAATFAVSGLALVAMRPVARTAGGGDREGLLAELRGGWRAFVSRRWLWVIVAYFTLYMGIGFAPFQVLGPEVARTSLGGPGAWAAISTALGIGSVGGGLLGLRWRPAHPFRVTMLLFTFSAPLLMVLLAAHAPLAAIVALALFDGSLGSLFNAFWFTAQQSEIPAEELSRVSSWDHLGTLVMEPAGLAATGPAAAAVGVSATLYGAAGAVFVLTAAVLAVRAVRDFSIDPDRTSKAASTVNGGSLDGL